MTIIKAKRLSKIAREFNVGISTIVEYLHKKGVKIASSPNTKVSLDCYELLVKEYSSEKNVKEESNKLNLRKSKERNTKASDESNLSDQDDTTSEIDSDEGQTVLITDNSTKEQDIKEVEIAKVQEPVSQKKEFKIVGKIDLDTFSHKKVTIAEKEKVSVVKETTLKNDEQQHAEIEDKNKETEQENIVETHPAEEIHTDDLTKEKQNDTEEVVKEKIVEEKIVDVIEIENKKEIQEDIIKEATTKENIVEKDIVEEKDHEIIKKETILDTKVEVENKVEVEDKIEVKQIEEVNLNEPKKENITLEQTSVQDEIIEVTKEDLEVEIKNTSDDTISEIDDNKKDKDLKVVGKIDLSAINQKTRPPRKTRKEKEQERKERYKARKQENNTDGKQPDEKVKGDEKRSKKKVILKSKKQDPETTDEKHIDEELFKSKIKKLIGPTVIGKIILPSGEEKKTITLADKKGDKKRNAKKKKRKRIKIPVTLEKDIKNKKATDEKKPLERGKRSIKIGKGKKVIRKREVNPEDVQKQIKETLARLTAGKKKNKGAKYRKTKRDQVSKKQQDDLEQQIKEKNILKVTEFVSVSELSSMMDVPVNEIISSCMSLGLLVSINQRLDAETMTLVAEEFRYKVEFTSVEVHEAIAQEEDKEEDLSPRPPIVTVMGHVDHGKTSLLDFIRDANVIAGEAGGITQHIGAYGVSIANNKKITFLDTPGHEAFTAMRARGAQITDIAIIVVAADDNVMPQTVEAINHATAAGVPIVFAINKIDKAGANPEKIKEKLANMNFLVEDWGGKFQSQDISAKQGLNIDELLEKVLLEAEMLELKANADKRAVGTVIESSLDKGRGYVTTLLIENGTLNVGDVVLAGGYTGRIKAMYNERNNKVKSTGPASPVIVLGLNGAPQAGDKFNIMNNEREAREIANKRNQLQREQGLRAQKHITLDEIGRRIAIGNFQELNVVVKGDVDGSIEALSDALVKLSTNEIQVNIIHKAVGQIAENDVMLATASNAIIIGFQVRPSVSARKLAEKEQIDIRLYSIIYDAINELKDAMLGMLSPVIKEEIIGTAEIREVFKISKVGTIAGCMVRDGKILKKASVRIIRDGIVIYTGELGSLKRFKEDVKEVASGFECGLNVEKFNDIKNGDIVETFKEVEVKRTL